MPERFKTFFLAGLILLSLYLTYILWFGGRYMEEVVLPRYEFVFFTPVPSPDLLLTPAEIVLQQREKEELILFRRGEAVHTHLWQAINALLQRKLPDAAVERPDEAALAALLQEASAAIFLRFAPPLPQNFLADALPAAAELHEIRLFASGDVFYLFLDGREKSLYRWFDPEQKALETLISSAAAAAGTMAEQLPPLFVLLPPSTADGGGAAKIIVPEKENEAEVKNLEGLNTTDPDDPVRTGDAVVEAGILNAEAGEREGDDVLSEGWKITLQGSIYLPVTPAAGEVPLTMEVVAEEELLRAFFLDPTMARRIKERDGATYYTDGKRGLRIYAGGALEYTAPGQNVLNNRLSYRAALQLAAENLSLYGGWPHNTFLVRREKTTGGYHFFWRSFVDGLPLVTEQGDCAEMIVNDKGMPYYRRGFYLAGREGRAEPLPYRHYAEALWQAVSLRKEFFHRREATLLDLKPVYRVITDAAGARAIPAWAVHFAETGMFYLHWQTLEPI